MCFSNKVVRLKVISDNSDEFIFLPINDGRKWTNMVKNSKIPIAIASNFCKLEVLESAKVLLMSLDYLRTFCANEMDPNNLRCFVYLSLDRRSSSVKVCRNIINP